MYFGCIIEDVDVCWMMLDICWMMLDVFGMTLNDVR